MSRDSIWFIISILGFLDYMIFDGYRDSSTSLLNGI